MVTDQIGEPKILTIERQQIVAKTILVIQYAVNFPDPHTTYGEKQPLNAKHIASNFSYSETFGTDMPADTTIPSYFDTPATPLVPKRLHAVTCSSEHMVVGRTVEHPKSEDNKDESETDYDDSGFEFNESEAKNDKNWPLSSLSIAGKEQAKWDAASWITYCNKMSVEAVQAWFKKRVPILAKTYIRCLFRFV